MRFLKSTDKTITISTITIIKTIVLIVSAYLIFNFIGEITHQLRLIIISIFLAIALNPAVHALMRKMKIKSRVRATGLAYVIVICAIAAFTSLVVPPLVEQTSDFIKNVPSTIENFKTQDSSIARIVRQYNIDEQLDDISNEFTPKIDDISGPLISTAERALGNIISIITVLVLTFMILVEGPYWFNELLALSTNEKRKEYRIIAYKMYKVVTSYVNGQVLIAAIASGFALIVMLIASSLTDSSINAVALAGIVFIFGLIPLIGNIISSVLVILFALFSSTTLAIVMGIYFIVYQQIENATLQPYIQSRSNQLTPLIVFIAALVGAGFGGLLGALAAIPTAGCLRILFEEYIKQHLVAENKKA